jgi:hypothetical protein
MARAHCLASLPTRELHTAALRFLYLAQCVLALPAQLHAMPAARARPCPLARQGCSRPHAGGARHSASAPTSSMRRC